jgi:uncharacterized protein YjiS (DUF1127 family)
MAGLRSAALQISRASLSCSAQRLETLKTERRRKETQMTTATAAKSDAGFLGAGVEHSAGSLAERARRALNDLRAYRATLAELGRLTDRQLSDVGMARDSLPGTARRAVYGHRT